MKKTILCIAFSLLGMSSTFAAKANPTPFKVMQSDGTELTVCLYGDEHFSWYATTDGALIIPVGKNFYIAQTEEDGSLKATPQLAHDLHLRGNIEIQTIKKQDKLKYFQALDTEMSSLSLRKSIGIGGTQPYFSHVGSPKALVLLVQFPDRQFLSEDPVTAFDYLMNADADAEAPSAITDYYQYKNYQNYGSTKQYFHDMSLGTFTPQFDVKGVVTVSKSYTYYGEDSGSSKDIHYTEMVKEACELAKSELGINFADYDANNDGIVDLVYIIHAGYGQNNGAPANTLWAKTNLTSAITTIDGKTIAPHSIVCEQNGYPGTTENPMPNFFSGVGVICHEFSHCLGLPDLYPYNTKAYVNNQEPEKWDLMDAGEYLRNGYCPAPYTPWELDIMGWTPGIEELGSTPQQLILAPYNEERKAYKITADNGEYLLLQNIQQEGWGERLLSHGLLIYHVDYSRDHVGLDYRMNQTPHKPEFSILPADGIVLSGYLSGSGKTYTTAQYNESHYADPFPGKNGVTELLEAKLNSTTLTNLLYNIKEDANGVISFDYLKDITNGIATPSVQDKVQTASAIYTLDGQYLGTDAKKLKKGIYLIGKKKVVVSD